MPLIFAPFGTSLSQKKHFKRLVSLTQTDPLTGARNRAAFDAEFEKAQDNAQGSGTPFALLLVDLDKFKQVNDLHGHDAGDAVLCEVVRRLQAAARSSDAVYRLGGDEFAVLIRQFVAPEHATVPAARIVEAMARPFSIEANNLQLGASVGIAIFPDDASSGAELLRLADRALYRSKGTGRSRYTLASTAHD